jgi:hypothetical protein
MARVPFDARQRTRKTAEAKAFLLAALNGKPRPAAEVEAEARAAGFTHATIQVARERAHISSKRQGKAWIWTPPKTKRKQSVTA